MKNASKGIIIPKKSVIELSKLLDPTSESLIVVQISRNHVRIQKGEKRLTSKLINGKYPDYQAVIPKSSKHYIVLNRTALKEGVSRVSILSNEKLKSVTLRFSENIMTIKSANNAKEKAEEAIAVDYTGEALEISFNAAYLLDVTNSIGSEDIVIGISDSNSSALITPKSSDGSKYIIMPLAI